MPTRHNGREGAAAWTQAWELREEIEQVFGVSCALELIPPSPRNAPNYTPPSVCAIARTTGPKPRSVAQYKVPVSSVRGAGTVEAAAVRALSELWWSLERLQEKAASQADI